MDIVLPPASTKPTVFSVNGMTISMDFTPPECAPETKFKTSA